jgi:hypothetical protein
MEFLTPNLFLGFPIEESFEKKLNLTNPYIVSLFVKKNGDYLQEVTFKTRKYLGKFVGHMTDFSELELIEANIFSILKKLVPDHPYDQTPLVLFTLSDKDS